MRDESPAGRRDSEVRCTIEIRSAAGWEIMEIGLNRKVRRAMG
jgi:hypothetical protein